MKTTASPTVKVPTFTITSQPSANPSVQALANIQFQTTFGLTNVQLNLTKAALDTASASAVAATADYFMYLGTGSTAFVASFPNSQVQINRRKLMNQSDADYFIQVQTVASLAGFPSYQNNPPALFKYLSGLLTESVADGRFTSYLNKLSAKMDAQGTQNATCIVTAYEHLNVIYPVTFSPTSAPITLVGLARIGNAEMAGIIIASLMFAFLVALLMYHAVRHVGRINKETNLIQKYAFTELPEPIGENPLPISLKDSDLDKIEYIGDTAKI